MMRISANLGFLWKQLPLIERIRRAAAAGFDAVELHDDWRDCELSMIAEGLRETELPMVSINTFMGDSVGLGALPGRDRDARTAIDEAFEAAQALGASAVHLVAGKASGDAARNAYASSLDHACRHAPEGLVLLIEPLSSVTPGYFLDSLEAADEYLRSWPRLCLLFDCYHVAMSGHDPVSAFRARQDRIGHVQFAGVPDRGDPGKGRIDMIAILRELEASAYRGHFGAEYRAAGEVEGSLGWMSRLRPPIA